MDIHILYEHIEREIYNAFLIKFELEKRGYTVKISRIQEPRLPFFNAPKLLVVPWFSVDSHVNDFKMGYLGRIHKILNLQYEQVVSQMWLEIGHHTPSGITKKGTHLCWGENRKQVLLNNGVPKENILVIGDIRQDFSKPEFKSFFKTKEQLSEEFNIPINHEWHLFISSFSFSKPNENSIKFINETIGMENSEKWHCLSQQSQKYVLTWIEQFVRENPNHEFIYRPHPSEVKETDYSDLKRLNDGYPNFHFIFKYSVQDWILASEYINTWISTSIIECYKLNKVCNILRPIKVDEYFDIPFYINATHISDYESFKNSNLSKNSMFPINQKEIKSYYNNIDDEGFVYKKICDYIEEIIHDDSYKKDFYNINPFFDNSNFIFKKIVNNRIFSILKNFVKNSSDNELEYVEKSDNEKIMSLKKIVEDNFD